MNKYLHKKVFLFQLLFSFALLYVNAQSSSFKENYTIETKSDFIKTDQLGNVYCIYQDQVKKYDRQGKQTATYSNNYLGQISWIDVTNPLRVLLYFNDFNQIVILDKKLVGIIQPIELDNNGFLSVQAVCPSQKGCFWIFSSETFQAFRLDNRLEIINKSQNLSYINSSLEVSSIIEKNGLLYINSPKTGIIVLDGFANYLMTIPIKVTNSFVIQNNNISYYKEGKLLIYNIETRSFETMVLPVSGNVKDVIYANGIIYVITNSQIKSFSIAD